MRKLTLFLLVLFTLAALPALAQDGAAPGTFAESDCWFGAITGHNPRCGYLTVPEDHNNPDSGRTLRLAVAIFPATGADPAPDPLIYLEGGPGGSPLEILQFTFSTQFAAFTADRDVIIFDQRGVGYSEPALDCPELTELQRETLDQALSLEENTRLTNAAFAACQARLVSEGVDLTLYNSAQNAADVALLWQSLGYSEVNLYGISYGTRLALTIMRDQPQGVRSVMIDSVYPPNVNLLQAPLNANRAFEALFAGCAADADCNAAYPDLESVFYETAARLTAAPAEIEVRDLNTLEALPAVLNGDSFITLTFQALYSADLIPSLPQAIYAARAGSFSFYEQLYALLLFQADVLSYGMYNSVQCSEDTLLVSEGELTQIAAEIPDALRGFAGDYSPEQVFGFCQDWGVTALPALENEAVTSDIPTLVMAGEYDPITPPAWAELAAQTLPNSTYFLVPGVGHGAIPASECATRIALAFLADPTTPPDGSCLASAPAPDFSIAGEAVTLVPFTNEDLGISSVAPEGWQETSQTVSGLIVLIFQRDLETNLSFIVLATPQQQFLQGLALQTGGALPDPAQTLAVEGVTWTIYELVLMGIPFNVAVAEIDGLTYVLQLQTMAEESAALVEQVLVPAVQALRPLQ
ncbi:MAG: alpha/beta fold hydrolase [Chloroflexi bacterium]|nr:alpha/beta fold hydrolase [Chloroflexota bacterium]